MLVQIKKQFLNPGESQGTYKLIEDREDRVLIEYQCDLPIKPTECVPKEMIEKI